MTEPAKHAILSPSGAAGWLVCAGKPAMEKGFPDDSNEYSDYGTAAHTLAAMCFEANQDPAAYLHRRIDVGNCKTVEVDEEMVGGVRVYVNAVRERVGDYKRVGAISVELMIEQRVPIAHITGEEGAEGTADVVILVVLADRTGLIDVWDLKFGVGVKVYAPENPQGMLYALGAVKKFAMLMDFDRVRIAIHQPRVSEEPSDWEITIDELNAFGKHASDRAKLSLIALEFADNWLGKPDSDQYLKAGDHCRKTFCKARATCPKLAAFVEESVGAGFDVIVEKKTIPVITAQGGYTDDDQELSAKMKATDIVEDWCKAVRAETERRLLAGVPVPDFKLVQGRQGNRAWENKDEAEKLMKSFRLKQEEMYSFSLISPTDAEKLAPKIGKDGKPKDTTKTPIKLGQWQKLQPLISRAPGKPSVAPEHDERPALVLKPATDGFAAVAPGSALV